MKIGRLTLSDRAIAGIYPDLSGPEIERVFREHWGAPCEFEARLLTDERDAIAAQLRELCDRHACPLVITTGGTGPMPRDVTPEATRDVLEKELPGFGEAMRMASFARVPTAILSLATAGIRGRSLIVNLPGMETGFLRRLAGRCMEGCGVVPEVRAQLEPLAAIYPRSAHTLCVQHLQTGRRAVRGFAQACVEARLLQLLPVAPAEESLLQN